MSKKETAKKVVGFLLFARAFNQRNLTSLGLVIFFFVLCWMSGMRIDAVPKLSPDRASFGGVAGVGDDRVPPPIGTGKVRPEDRSDTRGTPVVKPKKNEINRSSSIEDEDKKEDVAPSEDPLSAIEKRVRGRDKGE